MKFAVELPLAACVLFGIIFGLARLAEYRQNLPVRPGRDGTVTLDAPRATLNGQLRLFPTDLENQTEDYGNEYGRELVRERENRKIGNWNSVDDFAQWQFRLDSPGVYEVSLELAVPDDEAGGKFAVTVGTHALSGTVPSTGGGESWKTVPVRSHGTRRRHPRPGDQARVDPKPLANEPRPGHPPAGRGGGRRGREIVAGWLWS